MAQDLLLLSDGVSRLVLSDGVSRLLLSDLTSAVVDTTVVCARTYSLSSMSTARLSSAVTYRS